MKPLSSQAERLLDYFVSTGQNHLYLMPEESAWPLRLGVCGGQPNFSSLEPSDLEADLQCLVQAHLLFKLPDRRLIEGRGVSVYQITLEGEEMVRYIRLADSLETPV